MNGPKNNNKKNMNGPLDERNKMNKQIMNEKNKRNDLSVGNDIHIYKKKIVEKPKRQK